VTVVVDVGTFVGAAWVMAGASKLNDCTRVPTSCETVSGNDIAVDIVCTTGLVSAVAEQATIDDEVHAVVRHHTDDPAVMP